MKFHYRLGAGNVYARNVGLAMDCFQKGHYDEGFCDCLKTFSARCERLEAYLETRHLREKARRIREDFAEGLLSRIDYERRIAKLPQELRGATA